MTRLDHDRVMEILAEVMELPPPRRAGFLDSTCAGEPELRRRIEELLNFAPAAAQVFDLAAEQVLQTDPDRIGPYTNLEPIGEGGMAIVYKANQSHPVKRTVAIKLIKLGMDTRQFVARFEAERQALAIMDHPHVARVFDAGATETGRPYFVMEYVPGKPILDYCDEKRLDMRLRLELFTQVCDAVEHAHRKGILHRDIKNSNVLVTELEGKPFPKVIDFGVAKALQEPLTDRTLQTEPGQLIGTPEYMSPEQAERGALDVDTRSDVYSLGVLLYELIAGVLPITSEQLRSGSYEEVRRIIRETDTPRPSTRLSALASEERTRIAQSRRVPLPTLIRELRSELEWIPLKATRRDREQRYRSASELADDIRNYLAGRPLIAGPESGWYRTGKFLHRHKTSVTASAAILLLLGLAAVAGSWLALRAMRAERIAAEERDTAIAEQRRANDEAAIARAVNDFLQNDLLSQADVRQQPLGEERRKDLSILELLDRASRSIEGRFPRQELTEAAVRLTLGNTYRSLGAYEKADQHLNHSLRLRQDKLPANHPEILECIYHLGLLDLARGRYADAEQRLRQALDGRKVQLGPVHADTLDTMNSLAGLIGDLGRLDEAEEFYRQGLNTPQGNSSNSDKCRQTRILIGLARLYQARGQYKQAEELFERALGQCTAVLGEDHPDSVSIRNRIAILYRIQGRYDDARRLYQQVLVDRRRLLGIDHPETFAATSNLAALYMVAGDLDQAEPLFRQVLDGVLKKLGPDHPETLASATNLGVLYRAQGRYDEAETLCRQALDGRRKLLGNTHPDTLVAMNNLASVLMSKGMPEEAEPLFRQALAASREALGERHPHTLAAMNSLATVYLNRGRFIEAEQLYRQVLEANRVTLGSNHPHTLVTKSNLSRSLFECGRFVEAESLSKEVLESMRSKLGPNHPNTLREMNNLAMIYAEQKNWEAAIPLLEKTLEMRRQKLGATHPNTLQTLAYLGTTLRDNGQMPKGIEFLEEALALARQKPGPLPDALRSLPGMLAESYDRTGRFEKAEAIYRASLQEARGRYGDDDPLVHSLQAQLGRNLLEQKKYAEAEPLLREHYERLNKTEATKAEVDRSPVREAVEDLIQLYERWGNTDEAQRWREAPERVNTSAEIQRL